MFQPILTKRRGRMNTNSKAIVLALLVRRFADPSQGPPKSIDKHILTAVTAFPFPILYFPWESKTGPAQNLVLYSWAFHRETEVVSQSPSYSLLFASCEQLCSEIEVSSSPDQSITYSSIPKTGPTGENSERKKEVLQNTAAPDGQICDVKWGLKEEGEGGKGNMHIPQLCT